MTGVENRGAPALSYERPRAARRESRTLVGRSRGGKLAPIMAVAVRGRESGLMSQEVTLELDPIAGRMITPIFAEITAVYVPVQAIDAIKDPDGQFSGLTEVLREKLLSGNPLFGLELEGEISKRCGVNPRSIGGQMRVNEMVRLGHNAAVNYLRTRKYVKATKLLANNTAITPALISHTVLQRLNGVLDPDDRINGAVDLEMPNMKLPVEGIGFNVVPGSISPSLGLASGTRRETVGNVTGVQTTASMDMSSGVPVVASSSNNTIDARPLIFANLNGGSAGQVSLTDFYNAETMDRIVRNMSQVLKDYPEQGPEIVARAVHGLSVDTGKIPFIVYQSRQAFGRNIASASDAAGIQDDIMRSDMVQRIRYNISVPNTELGGVIFTFLSVTPDETIPSQPHPYLSDVWGVDNFAADELALDPVPVTMRELDSACGAANESTVALYTGHNGLKQTYVHYGLNRQVDPDTVENKTAIWQLEIPMSVTPDNILYPADLPHYPFADQLAEVCSYTISSNAVIQTNTIFGPTPVEDLAGLGVADFFEQE